MDRPANGRRFLYFQRDGGDSPVELDKLQDYGIDPEILLNLDQSKVAELEQLVAEMADKYPEPSGGASEKLVKVLKQILALIRNALGYSYPEAKESEPATQADNSNADEKPAQVAQRDDEIEKLRKKLEETTAQLDQERKIRRAEQQLEELVEQRHILPAQRDKLEPLFVALQGMTIVEQSADGEVERQASDVLVEALRAHKISDDYFRQIADSETDEAKRAEQIAERIAKRAGAGGES